MFINNCYKSENNPVHWASLGIVSSNEMIYYFSENEYANQRVNFKNINNKVLT